MTQKVVTKKSFIGGRIVLPGETVDVDAKGGLVAAPSSPVGNLTIEQLEAVLAARKAKPVPADQLPEYGSNVADPDDTNTGAQPLEMARVRPGDGSRPQVIPSGAEEHHGTFVRPAPAEAPAAVEVVVGPGEDGAAVAGSDQRQVGLTGKTKPQLLEIAKAEQVEVADDATVPEIREAIEKKRSDA